jgi:ABC-type multidrug transport system fused ATPase/permease subunit
MKSESWLTTDICIYIYTALIIGVIVISLVRAFAFYGTCMRASENLHNKMFYAITRATMAFFNNNPSGTIKFINMSIILVLNILSKQYFLKKINIL